VLRNAEQPGDKYDWVVAHDLARKKPAFWRCGADQTL
jgi:hypothetical protein